VQSSNSNREIVNPGLPAKKYFPDQELAVIAAYLQFLAFVFPKSVAGRRQNGKKSEEQKRLFPDFLLLLYMERFTLPDYLATESGIRKNYLALPPKAPWLLRATASRWFVRQRTGIDVLQRRRCETYPGSHRGQDSRLGFQAEHFRRREPGAPGRNVPVDPTKSEAKERISAYPGDTVESERQCARCFRKSSSWISHFKDNKSGCETPLVDAGKSLSRTQHEHFTCDNPLTIQQNSDIQRCVF
jgi:hypothetical protein